MPNNSFTGPSKSFGGLEFSPYANSTIVGTIATKSSAVAVIVMVPNSLGPGELLLHFGTQEQQAHYLPRLANGTDIPCFALTSPVVLLLDRLRMLARLRLM